MKYKEVKYKVLDAFGQIEEGTVISALLLVKDGNRGLLYHPYVKGECPSFEIGQEMEDGIWVQADPELYVNVDSGYRKLEVGLFGQDFSFRRVVYGKEEVE